MWVDCSLKLQKYRTAAKSTGSGNRRPKLASWFCHSLSDWEQVVWPFSASFADEDSNSADHTQLMWSYMSYCNCGEDHLQLSLLSSLIPRSPSVRSLSIHTHTHTHTVCSSPLDPTSSRFDLIPFLSFTSKLLMERIVHLLFAPFQSHVYLCYSNGAVHQNHPEPPFCVKPNFKGLMGYNFSAAIDPFLTPLFWNTALSGFFLVPLATLS